MPPRLLKVQVAVAAILPPVWRLPASRLLVQAAFAGPLATHLWDRRRPASQCHQALDLPQHCEPARELCAPNPIAVEVVAEPGELPAWLLRQRGLPSGE